MAKALFTDDVVGLVQEGFRCGARKCVFICASRERKMVRSTELGTATAHDLILAN